MFDSTAKIIEGIRALSHQGLDTVLAFWLGRNPEQWRESPRIYFEIGSRFLELGECIIAYDAVQEGLNYWPESAELFRIKAVSLARCGAASEANEIMRKIVAKGAIDDETCGIFARTYKDLWLAETNVEASHGYLRRALELYESAYLASGSYWLGINAATLAWIDGDSTKARKYAAEICQSLKQLIDNGSLSDGDAYWLSATMGEASLILGDLEAAKSWYVNATSAPKAGYGNIASTRRNAKLLAQYGCCDAEFIDNLFPKHRIAVFTGHVADAPGRETPRLPAEFEAPLSKKMTELLIELDIKIGFSAAASGADILFLETMLNLGRVVHIVLPFPAQYFIQTSVLAGEDSRWVDRFHRVIAAAASVTSVSAYPLGNVSFTFGNLVLFGLAKAKMREIDGALEAIAVWDGKAGATGGTGATITSWRTCGQPLTAIAPDGSVIKKLAPETPQQGVDLLATSDLDDATTERAEPGKLVSFFFGDVVGYSKLGEFEIKPFVEQYLGTIAQTLKASCHRPIVKNTWGDGLYFVFKSSKDAGIFALDMIDQLAQTDWAAKGLPKDINIRVALHSGPAFERTDPITETVTYTGSHASRAARIEPVTPPGQIYCSQEFAAIVEAENVKEFRCVYVGQTPLAKGFGTFATYRVRR